MPCRRCSTRTTRSSASPGSSSSGSNDYFAPKLKNPLGYLTRNHASGSARPSALPTADLVRGLGTRGWIDLTNRRDSITVRGLRIDVRRRRRPAPRLRPLDLVGGPASPDADLTLGVTHAPYQRVLDAYAADGADLIVAGHTHGGQVCVPGYGALVTNCDLDTGRVKGLSRWWPGAGSTPSSHAPAGAAWLEVSAGLGTAPTAPVRLACRPEATLLTLVPRAGLTRPGRRTRPGAGGPDSEMDGGLR